VSSRQPRVLIVDDEDGIRELCRVNLELEGYDVLEAADGPAAVATATSEELDLIVLDLMMPGMDGWEVLRRLQADERAAAVPVVVLTAKAGQEDEVRASDQGVLDYVRKPFDPLVLREWVDRALRPRGSAAP
jgi:DNA-binding response OmpR family regulator